MVTIEITNCTECPDHKVINDPDPHDWFCDDDVAVVCKKTINPHKNLKSDFDSDKFEFRAITVSCRPYNIKKECNIPLWCPRKIS